MNLINTQKSAIPFLIAVVFGMIASMSSVQSAHAQWDYVADYGYMPDSSWSYAPDYGASADAYSYAASYTPDAWNYTPDSAWSYAADSWSYTPDAWNYAPDSWSYTADSAWTYTPDTYASAYSYPYSSGYGYSPSYMAYSYSSPGYSYGYPISYSVASYPLPAASGGNTIVNDNDATCTTPNSCNTIIDDHSVVNANTTISSPTTISYNNAASPAYTPVYYPTPSYPTYTTYNQPTCYITITPSVATRGQAVTITWSAVNATYGTISEIGAVPMSGSRTIYAYQNMTYAGNFSGPGGSTNCYATLSLTGQSAPYVTLSQVPYTGLELSPTATALYWLFLLLWCAVGAYLLAVKKIQNQALAWVGKMLVGDQKAVSHPAYHSAARTHTTPTATREHAQSDTADSFIMDQINRNNR